MERQRSHQINPLLSLSDLSVLRPFVALVKRECWGEGRVRGRRVDRDGGREEEVYIA
jgi:hypothetical protein